MTKQEFIKSAYIAAGVDWEAVKEYVDEDGWLTGYENMTFKTYMSYRNVHECRPFVLTGIEDNNGWYPYNEDPKGEIGYFIIFQKNLMTIANWDNDKREFYAGSLVLENVTHYQPIHKPSLPLY